MVRLPPPAVLMMGVGFVVVAPVETIATLPMVSVAPLKSRMPRPLRVTTPVPIMSGFVVEAAYCTVAAVLSAPPTVRPPAGIAWTPLTPFTLANASVPPVTVVRPLWVLAAAPEKVSVPAPDLSKLPVVPERVFENVTSREPTTDELAVRLTWFAIVRLAPEASIAPPLRVRTPLPRALSAPICSVPALMLVAPV